MWFLCLLFPLLSPSSGQMLKNNTVWIANENLVITLDKLYENLPNSVIKDSEDANKRAFAVLAELVLLYAAANDTEPVSTVKKLMTDLHEPADVIGADARKHLDTLRARIDQPINDIKRACKPKTSAMACIDKLFYYQKQQKDKCPKYEEHQKLREVAESLAGDAAFQKFLNEALTLSKEGKDMLTVAFFTESVYKYENLFKRFTQFYKLSTDFEYSCISLGQYDG